MAKGIISPVSDDAKASAPAELQVQSLQSGMNEADISVGNTQDDGNYHTESQGDDDKKKQRPPPIPIITHHPSIADSTANFIMDSDGKISSPVNKNFVLRYFKKKTEGLSQRQVIIVIVFAFVEFFAATVISIQAPFFPYVAELKGATAIEHGFVFAIFEIVVFTMSPLFGAKMGIIGPKKLFNYGIFTTGLCCIIFGFLNHIEGRVEFIVMCLIVRGIEAVGDAAFVTASFTIIAVEFPDNVATTFATMETFYGLGMICGPTLGGALYEAGGYTLPFALMGGLLFASAVATYFLLPDIGQSKAARQENSVLVTANGFEMFRMLRIPALAMIAYSIVSTAGGVGFLSASLEPHLREFELNKFTIGMVFTLNGGVYALTAPAWGRICDRSSEPKFITLVGSAFTIGGFILLGPLPILPFETSLWAISCGLVLFGLGLGATLVSAFIQALQDSIARGYPDDVRTYGLVSGLWVSMMALGFFIGSSMGGILLHHVGFAYGTTFIIGGQLILVGCLMIYFKTQGKKTPKTDIIEEVRMPGKQDALKISKTEPNGTLNPAFTDDKV